MGPSPDDTRRQSFDANDPAVQVLLLAQRIDTLVREKEEDERQIRELAKRIDDVDRLINKGWGMAIIIPILGAALGFILAYGKTILAPWMKQ